MVVSRSEAVKKFLLVFAASFCIDCLWTLTVIETNALHTWRAAALSGVLFYAGAYVTISYVKESRLVHAAALGSILGTIVTISVLRQLTP